MKTRTIAPTLLALAAVLIVPSACVDAPTQPHSETLDVGLLEASADPGMGADITRFTDNSLILLTQDPVGGLFSVHYSGSAALSGFLGCSVPEYSEGLETLRVGLPTGGQHIQAHGEVYVLVYDLAGFPGNIFACEQPLAEGAISLTIAGGTGPLNFSSNGTITDNVGGGDVRLHHSRQLVAGPPVGTVRLQ